MAGVRSMNAAVTLLARAEDYLTERRRLGYGLRTSAYTIKSFARYVDDLGHEGPLTVELMAAWACRVTGNRGRPTQCWARRLKRLRSFARWMQQFDPRTEVPDDSIFGRVGERLAPHIYTEQEVIDLLGAARRLDPPLRGSKRLYHQELRTLRRRPWPRGTTDCGAHGRVGVPRNGQSWTPDSVLGAAAQAAAFLRPLDAAVRPAHRGAR